MLASSFVPCAAEQLGSLMWLYSYLLEGDYEWVVVTALMQNEGVERGGD
jgi:hypothetical protein